jgi:hypothetical protein
LRRQAKRLSLPVNYFGKGTFVFEEGEQQFYLSNKDQFKNEIDKIGLKDIFYDCIVDKHKTDPTKLQIVACNSRGNGGPSLGYTGGKSLKDDPVSGIGKPSMVKGIRRFAHVARSMRFLHEQMHTDAGFKIMWESTCFPGCREDFVMNVDEENCFELFSLLSLVHDKEENPSYRDFLEYHCDWGTCPHFNFLACAWKTFFVPSL